MARSIRSTSPVMKNQFSCRPAACVKCDTHSNFSYKIPQISSAGFRSGCFVRSALFHADCSRRSSCFRYCLFEESVDHHSRCWCICGSLFFSKKSVRSRLSVGAFVVRCFFSKKSVRSPLSVGAFVVRCCSSTLGWRVCGSICVRTAQSVVLHRCQMPRGHAPARFRSESSVRAVVVDESLTVCASDMSLGEATCEESGLECTFQSCMVQC